MTRRMFSASGLGGKVMNHPEPLVIDMSPRQTLTFWCAAGHATHRIYATGIDVIPPATEDCQSCWQLAVLSPEGPPPSTSTLSHRPYKTHLEYVKERRTLADIEVLLSDAINLLHALPVSA